MRNLVSKKIRSWRYPPPVDGEWILDRRRIYILPNKAGWIFTLLLLCILITSINYGINLGYGLNFILIGCGWLGIIYTFRNIVGLGIEAAASTPIFAGGIAHFAIQLNNHAKHARYALEIGFDKAHMQLVDIPQGSSQQITLATKSHRRGWLSYPQVRIQTSFPFGLLTTWAYWQTTQRLLVYPAPEANPPPLPFVADGLSTANLSSGDEEFGGVRHYQTGDSLKHLAWRQIARQSGGSNELLLSKHFEGGRNSVCELDFASLPLHLSVEAKLARLCAWVLLAEQDNVSYAFKLGNIRLRQNFGEDHQRACLTALALFGESEE